MRYVIFYNPLAGSEGRHIVEERLNKLLNGDRMIFQDVTKLGTVAAATYIDSLEPDDRIVIAGGDGTVNRFVNCVDCDTIKQEVYLYPSGSGNDMFTDLKYHLKEFYPDFKDIDDPDRICTLVQINKFITNLPTVEVEGRKYKFVNGVGYGIDGYCCEVGDRLKRAGKKVNYTGIAIKGLLFHFKPKNATVIVDGTEYKFKKTWIAPTMNGVFYGGGMMPTPDQNRAERDHLSLCVMHGKGKIGTLMIFPKIFSGEHVKKQKAVKILTGKEITVKFDKPCALQIDGETILNVSEYTARI